MGRKFRLTEMDLDEISVVFSGDDPKAEVVIAKSATNQGDSTTVTVNDAWEEDMPQDDVTINKDDLPTEVVDYIDALETAVESLLDDDGSDTSQDDVAKSDDTDEKDDDMDAFLAKADPRMLDLIIKANDAAEAAEERALAAEEAIAKERHVRERQEAIAKAESMVMISDDAEDLADLLLALQDQPEVAEKVEKLFRAADAQIRKGNLFEEIGKSTTGFAVSSEAEAQAAEIRKTNPELTPEQALVAALEANPAAYDSMKED